VSSNAMNVVECKSYVGNEPILSDVENCHINACNIILHIFLMAAVKTDSPSLKIHTFSIYNAHFEFALYTFTYTSSTTINLNWIELVHIWIAVSCPIHCDTLQVLSTSLSFNNYSCSSPSDDVTMFTNHWPKRAANAGKHYKKSN
jgi:hypothetical protein